MRRKTFRHGLALVATLWILAVLAILTWGFTRTVQTDMQIANNFTGRVRARYFAQAGVHRIAAELSRTLLPYYAGDQPWVRTDAATDNISFEWGSYQVEVIDEAGKLNVNQASTSMLTALFGDAAIASAIRDWIDPDDRPRQLGAEEDYYMGLPAPYHCRNAPLATVQELLLVRDVTPELLLGTEEVLQTSGASLSDSSTTSTLAETGEAQSLLNLLTVYTEEPNVDAQGNPRVNIATASRGQLRRALGDVLSQREIDAIITYRDGTSGSGGGPTDARRGGREGGRFRGDGGGGGARPPFGGGAPRGRPSRGVSVNSPRFQSTLLAQRPAGGGGARPPGGGGRPGGGRAPGGFGAPGMGGRFPGGRPPGTPGQPPFGGDFGRGRRGEGEGRRPPFAPREGRDFGEGRRPPREGRDFGEGRRPPFGPGGPGGGPGIGGRPGGFRGVPGRGFRRLGDIIRVPGLSRDKVRAIADRLTTTDETPLRGKVNINTAPAAVLAALPGMDAAIAQDIVNYRTGTEGVFTSIGDILQVPSVTNDVFRRVADYITVCSFTYRIRAQGVLRNSHIQRQIEAVIVLQPVPMDDLSATGTTTTNGEPQIPFIETIPRIVYWREF